MFLSTISNPQLRCDHEVVQRDGRPGGESSSRSSRSGREWKVDEPSIIMKARTFVRTFGELKCPVPMDPYADAIGAGLQYSTDLPDNESGHSLHIKGQWCIIVN